MLYALSISNYALIHVLDVQFSGGLTIITGETGAGKSIILGALSLVLGQRADAGVLRDSSVNAVVEAGFRIPKASPDIEHLFSENEVDYSDDLIIRRIISPGGKSRSFVNDQPVPLNFLRSLGNILIDIHSQHGNLLLSDSDYPVRVADAFAGLGPLSEQYSAKFREVISLSGRVRTTRTAYEQTRKDLEYLSYQYQELQAAKLSAGEQDELEKELNLLRYAEEIRQSLSEVLNILDEGQLPVLVQLKDASRLTAAIASRNPDFSEVGDRMEQVRTELRDIAQECARMFTGIQDDPERMLQVSRRLDTIYSLQRKHNVMTVSDLLDIAQSVGKQLDDAVTDSSRLEALEKELAEATAQRVRLAPRLNKERTGCLSELSGQLRSRLALLGIPHARIEFSISEKPLYGPLGNTHLEILFSANKDVPPRELSRIASGGEMSRLMLCIKSVIARHSGLSTIIFDEVDMGVSGKIADCMGNMIHELSDCMQVLAITHLPQVAAKGNAHFLVKKEMVREVTETRLLPLQGEDRVRELARMLSGSSITPAAVQNAKDLLNYTS